MEISRLPSSALRFSDLRSHQIVASSLHTIKQLRASSYPSSSKHTQISPSRIAFSGPKTCSVLLTKLKPALLQVQAQQGATISELPKESNVDVKKEKNDFGVALRFLRPFAVQCSVVHFLFILARRLVENLHVLQGSNWLMIIKLIAAYASVACAHFYMIGINDIFDVAIDKINHPDLHLDSGEWHTQVAWVVMLSIVAISLLIAGILRSVPFVILIFGAHFLSSIYSIPPLRMKASTLGAPITNGLLQGFALFFAAFTGVGVALGLPFQLSLPMRFMSVYNIIYCFTMGFLKDIPDIEGDTKNNIPTIATIIGARKTLLIGTCILIINHVSAATIAATIPEAFKSPIMIPGHILSIFFVLYQAWKMDRANYEMIQSRESYLGFARNYLVHLILFPFI